MRPESLEVLKLQLLIGEATRELVKDQSLGDKLAQRLATQAARVIASEAFPKARAQLEALVWRHTHKDFRGTHADGTRTVLHLVNGGTQLWALSSFPLETLVEKLPRKVRLELGL